VPTILQELHSGVGGGHFSSNITMKKIFNVSYWWPTMDKDVHELRQTYDLCLKTCNMLAQNMAKLITILLEKPFQNGDWTSLDPSNQQVITLTTSTF